MFDYLIKMTIFAVALWVLSITGKLLTNIIVDHGYGRK